MKIVMVTPYYHQSRGNTVTVRRISAHLAHLGVKTETVSVTDENLPPVPPGDIIHGFNAYQFYRYRSKWGPFSCPYLVTMTGTDFNHYLFQEQTRDAVIDCLDSAQAVHVFNQEAGNILYREVPWIRDKMFIIPQGIDEFPPAEGSIKKQEGSFLLVLPAGIRRVKNIPAAISMLAALHEQEPKIRLWIAGPVIEEEEDTRVQQWIRQHRDWIRYLGAVPHQEMGEIYRCADVVLNTSLSEGQSSAVLEAMAAGIPVVVSNITGNRDIVSHGVTGFLYNNEQEFIHYIRLLMEDRALRWKMETKGKAYIKERHSPEKEARDFLEIYRHILPYSQ